MNFLKYQIWSSKLLIKRCFSITPVHFADLVKSTTCDLRECRADLVCKDCVNDMCAIDKNIQPPCVVIIGAGVAGLSAAHRLLQCGISNFRILEATDRPGGRIQTCWLGDSIVELGASMISGASIANNMFTLAAQEGLLKYPLRRVGTDDGIYFTSDGRAIDFELAKKAKSIFYALESTIANIVYAGQPIEEKNLKEFFDNLIKKELKKLPETERYDAARIFYGLENRLKSRIGDELSKVSPTALSNLNELPGGNVMVPLGMGGLLAPLIRDLPKCSLIYCKPVHSIRWGTAGPGNPRAVVRCCDGDDFPADYVIVTVPLGVLKKVSATLFCPALPANKTAAIEKLGFGFVERIFMEHQNPFWSGRSNSFRLAWSAQESDNIDDWVVGVTSFDRVLSSNKILYATIAGEKVKVMESKSNAQLVKDLTMLMRNLTGDASLPPAISVMKSNWSINPNFYGSYTYLRHGSSVGHIHDLGEPLPDNCNEIPPIILFAGEHTSPKYFASMHGARQTGIREADRIICLTKNLKGSPNKGPPCIPCQ